MSSPEPDLRSFGINDSSNYSDAVRSPGFVRGELDPAVLPYMPPPRKTHSSRRAPILLGMLVLTCVTVPLIAYFRSAPMPASAEAAAAPTPRPTPAAAPAQGTVSVTSNPSGAEVIIDNEVRGVTPLKLTLPAGSYTLELRHAHIVKTMPLTVTAHATVEPFADLVPSLATSGRLEITSNPPGASVVVDGVQRGVTPLVLAAVPAGPHRVMLSDGVVTVNRTVTVVEGRTVTVSAAMTPAGAAGGWISVKTPFEMQVLSGGRVVGTTRSDRIMLPVGTHDLELVSEAFQFRSSVNVRIQAGQTVDVPVTLPNGSLSINAIPWADVWIDGKPAGQTPLGHVAVPIGEHEIVWRHPQLGERRQTVRVATHTATRVGVDFNR
jgi:hypothetical protein